MRVTSKEQIYRESFFGVFSIWSLIHEIVLHEIYPLSEFYQTVFGTVVRLDMIILLIIYNYLFEKSFSYIYLLIMTYNLLFSRCFVLVLILTHLTFYLKETKRKRPNELFNHLGGDLPK